MKATEKIDRQLMAAVAGRGWNIGSLVCAALALGFVPVVLGPLGVVAGAISVWKRDRLGNNWSS